MDRKHVIVILLTILLSIVLITSGTYAYFIINVEGNAELMKITSGKLQLTIEDNNIINLPNAQPGDEDSKTFTVENTGTVNDTYTYNYNIKLSELNVSFQKKDLVYTLQEYTNDQYNELKPDGVNETGYINKDTVNEDNEMYLAVGIERPLKGTKHYYKITITFKNLPDVNQYYNQNANFTGKINIDDNRDAALYIPKVPFNEIMQVDNVNIFADDFNNIRYAGPSVEVNNYIWFNCDDYTDINRDNAESKGCEKWRIIGLFKNMQKVVSVSEEGVATYGTEDLVKIIRADSAGDIAWDTTGGQYGSNNWTRPADLQTSLTNYYNGTTLSNGEGIKDSTRPMIEQVTWNIGGYAKSDVAVQLYEYERGSTIPSGAEATWNGYIGLMYPSDYGYATTGSNSGTTRDTCLTTILGMYNNGCYQKDWLFSSSRLWTLTPQSAMSNFAYTVSDSGNLGTNSANSTCAVHPSLYLKFNVLIVGGKGTSTEPYILTQ